MRWIKVIASLVLCCTAQPGIWGQQLNIPAGNTLHRVDLSGLLSGVYLVQVAQEGKGVEILKLAVQQD